MTTKILLVQNDTNESIKFERMEWIQTRVTIDRQRGGYVHTDIPWCLSYQDYIENEKYIRVTFLRRNLSVLIWEANGTIYMGKRYKDPAYAIPGDASTNRSKVLRVTDDSISLHNATESQIREADGEVGQYFYDEDLAKAERVAPNLPIAGLKEAEIDDDLSMEASGWIRIYVRRASAGGAGHVGFAFKLDTGNWCVGGMENRWGTPIAPPSATGYWVKQVRPDQVNASFLNNSQIPAPYDAYKSVYVGRTNLDAAKAWLKHYANKSYVLYKSNCMDVTWNILKAYGAPIPDMTKTPNGWFNSVGAKAQELVRFEADIDEAVDALVPVQGAAIGIPNGVSESGKMRSLTPLERSDNSETARGWFNSAALPFASLCWPTDIDESSWRVTEIKGGFRPGTHVFLHTFSGMSVVADRAELDRLAFRPRSEQDAEIWEWLPIVSIAMKFLKFIGSAFVGIANSWAEFENSIGMLDKDGKQTAETPADAKKGAADAHLPPPDNAKKVGSVAGELRPKGPNDPQNHAGDGASRAVTLAATNLDGRLIAAEPGLRGLAIVFKHKDGRFEWLRVTPEMREACVLPESRLNEVPFARINSPETVTHMYTGWLEDPDDTNNGNATGASITGVIDFWMYS